MTENFNAQDLRDEEKYTVDSRLPVPDLYGDNDLPPVLATAARRKRSLADKDSRQVKIQQADHFFTGRETEMVEVVAAFLTDTLK